MTDPKALDLREATTTAGLDADGTVKLHVIRPGIGRGRGRHLYEADMLEKNAKNFEGWRMYVDHLSPEARKAAGGLPRSIRDLGGRITEAWWDPNVPEDKEKGFGQGAVVARAKPTPFVRELIENDPEIMEASISATATGVKPVDKDGKRVWMVEGIGPKGSVDWVTEAGAGGKVVSVMESVYEGEDHQPYGVFDSYTDEELREALKSEKPDLLASLLEVAEPVEETPTECVCEGECSCDNGEETTEEEAAEGGPDDEVTEADGSADYADELEAEIARLVKKGMDRKAAEAVAKKNLAKSKTEAEEAAEEEADEEGDEMGITPEQLQEVFDSGEFQEHIDALVEGRVRGLVEATLSDERDLIHEEARANAGRQIQLRDLRDIARAKIEKARLPEAWKAESKSKFDLVEGRPTPDLDVVDEIDDTGAVTKSATAILSEAVDAEVERQRKLLAAAQPTRVVGQGPVSEETEPVSRKGTLHGSLLEEAGFDDPDAVWGDKAPVAA